MGTFMLIISTENPDGTPNLAPMSSASWVADRCMLGMSAHPPTTLNLQRMGQCVLNLPSEAMVPAVNRLAKTTSREDMSAFKHRTGYRFGVDKFHISGHAYSIGIQTSACKGDLEKERRRGQEGECWR